MNQTPQPATAIPTDFPPPTQDEKTLAFLAELLQLFTGFLGPLIIFLVRRNSRFVSFHALQALLWQVLYLILVALVMLSFFFTFLASVPDRGRETERQPELSFFLAFLPFWGVAMVGWVINLILAIVYGIKALNGQWAEYPLLGKLARRWACG
jgi:uncharacterized Tic20 family protein